MSPLYVTVQGPRRLLVYVTMCAIHSISERPLMIDFTSNVSYYFFFTSKNRKLLFILVFFFLWSCVYLGLYECKLLTWEIVEWYQGKWPNRVQDGPILSVGHLFWKKYIGSTRDPWAQSPPGFHCWISSLPKY